MKHASTSLVVGTLWISACGLTPNPPGESESESESESASASDSDTPTGGPGLQTSTIYQIQQGEVPLESLVDVKGVVVTSPVITDKNDQGFFFVSELAGGPFSGIQVFVRGMTYAELVLNGQIPAVGDVIDIRATYTEFFEMSQLTLSSPGDLTVTGTSPLPAPSMVTAAEVTTGGGKAEDYEGCLVQIADATVTKPVEQFGEFQVDDVLIVDDLFFAPLPGPKPAVGTVFTPLVGLMTYSFEARKMVPRFCADYTGWDDCEDPVDPSGGENVETTIYDIQGGKIAEETFVELKDVVVTAGFHANANDTGVFFIAEQDGGEFSGIQVYVYADVAAALMTADKLPQRGQTIDIVGRYVEFFEFSQLTLSDAESLTVTGTAPLPAANVVDAAALTVEATAEPHEGCLVRVEDVTVSQAANQFGEFELQGGLLIDDLFFSPDPGPDPTVGDTFASITGLLNYSFEKYKLAPRDTDDLVP